ncbi:MAG: hypothetical protein HZB39_15525 [Planctomycetes bacterium]|nr:hypothetical protein [Planctomycetota bacterium]
MRGLPIVSFAVVLLDPLVSQSPLADRSADALIAMLASDDDATPAMVELRRRGASVARALAVELRRPMLGDHAVQAAHERAARVLYDLREQALPAFDELEACLRDAELAPWVAQSAASILVRVAPFCGDARGDLLALLPETARGGGGWRQEAMAMHQGLVSSLAFDGAGAPLIDLLDALEGEDPFARNAACAARVARRTTFQLRRVEVLGALRAALDRQITPDRTWQWTADGRSLMCLTTEDGWRAMQTEVARALHAYEPDDERGLLAVCQELWDLDPAMRIAAAKWLGDHRLVDAGRWLVAVAEDLGEPPVAMAAIDALRRIGPDLAHLASRILAVGKRAAEDERVRARTPRLPALARATARALDPQLDLRPPVRGRVELLAAGIGHIAVVDVVEERRRLTAWLDSDHGAPRHRLRSDERLIAEYHELAPEQGGRASPRVRWVPMRVAPDEFRPGYWTAPEGFRGDELVVAAPREFLGPGWERHRAVPWIVVLVPVDAERPRLTATDLWGFREVAGPSLEFACHRESVESFARLLREARIASDALILAVDGLAIAAAPESGQRMRIPLRPVTDDRLAALRNKIE